MSRYQAIIFDLDGVLILSAKAHEEAFSKVLLRFDRVKWNYAEIAGMRTDEAMRMILNRAGLEIDEAELQELVRRKRELAHRILTATKPVASDCPKIVMELAKKFKLAIATSGSGAQLKSFFQMVTIESFFLATIHGEEVVSAKPDPEIYLAAAKRIGVAPDNCLVVEDAEAGIRAARSAGMDVVWMDHETFKLPADLNVVGKIKSLTELRAICNAF